MDESMGNQIVLCHTQGPSHLAKTHAQKLIPCASQRQLVRHFLSVLWPSPKSAALDHMPSHLSEVLGPGDHTHETHGLSRFHAQVRIFGSRPPYRRKDCRQNQAGILFLAWRCLYAELVRGRVDNVTPDLNIAYTRVISMNISRLKAYGERWLRWARKNKNTGNKSYIP